MASKASQADNVEEEGTIESGDTHLISPIHPPVISLQLKCQQVNYHVNMSIKLPYHMFSSLEIGIFGH